MAVNGDSFSVSGEEEKSPQNVSLFNYQTGVTLHDTLHAKADRVWHLIIYASVL